MEITDDYTAKFTLWARDPKPQPYVPPPPIPKFSPKRFASHEEMNRWKEELLAQIAKESPLQKHDQGTELLLSNQKRD